MSSKRHPDDDRAEDQPAVAGARLPAAQGTRAEGHGKQRNRHGADRYLG